MQIGTQVIDKLVAAMTEKELQKAGEQGHLNAWACWAVAWGPHKHRGPMLIYVCCDLLSVNKYILYSTKL